MNTLIQNEMQLIMSIKTVDGQSQIQILATLSKILSSEVYVKEIAQSLSQIVSAPTFNIFTDIPHLLLLIIELNSSYDFDVEIRKSHMQYILYGVLYEYFLTNNISVLNSMDLQEYRQLYLNCVELILLVPQQIKILKQSCISCFARTTNLRCLDNKKKIE